MLRPTWHLVAPEDLRWLLALTGPRVHAGNQSRYRQLEIDDRLAARARDLFEEALVGRHTATRADLRALLEAAGIEVDTARLTHLVMRAELEAVLCSGPRRGERQTYALLDERVAPSPPRERDEALAELARRYVSSHGPAQAVDFAWWSGLTIGDARRGLAGAVPALRTETVAGRTFWAADAPGATAAASVRSAEAGRALSLLPNYDELLVAFRDRTDALDPRLPGPARASEAILTNVVVRDGMVIGRWRPPDRRRPAELTLEIEVPLDATERAAIARAGTRYGAFAGRPVRVGGLD